MLAETLLRGPSSLTPAEWKMIATYVSGQNECTFCMNTYAAATRYLLSSERTVMDQVLEDPSMASISEKMKALLSIARKVQLGGRRVTDFVSQSAIPAHGKSK